MVTKIGGIKSIGWCCVSQDTVVALTCLGEFAKHIDVKHGITVNVTALHNKTFHKQLYVTNDNYEITQRTEVRINFYIG